MADFFQHKIGDKATPTIQAMRGMARTALLSAAREYIGKAAGGVSGGTGGGGGTPNYFGRRFTSSNTHGFAPLTNKPHFVVVKRRDGKWVGFQYPGYATWKRQKFGNKPILVASGQMLRDLRSRATAVVEGDRAVAIFRLSAIAGYHYTGTNKMPKRDPVSPNDADRAAWRERTRIILNQLLARFRAANR